MTLGLRSLGSAANLWDDEFSGWAYTAHKQVIPLLGNGIASVGNAVLQEGAKGYREATLSFTAPDSAQKDLVRGYDESSETVTYTDGDGSTCDVRVLSFESSLTIADEWFVLVRLQQLTEPVPYDPPLAFAGSHSDSLGDLALDDVRYGFPDDAGSLDALEANREAVAAAAMTFTRFAVALSPSGSISADYLFLVRVNGADTELVLDPEDPGDPLSAPGQIDGSVAVAEGDTFCVRVEKLAEAAAPITAAWTITYELA